MRVLIHVCDPDIYSILKLTEVVVVGVVFSLNWHLAYCSPDPGSNRLEGGKVRRWRATLL